jgi:hypothetical protein
VLAFTELKFSNSMIEAWWRSLKHQWLYLHPLDSVSTVRRLAEFYVHEHNRVLPFHIPRFADRHLTRCTFMKRRVNYPYVSIGSLFLLDTRPFIAHGPVSAGSIQEYCASPSACLAKRGGSHFYTRFIRGTSSAGARDDSREEQRFLRHGSHTRPGTSTRLLLQLDDRVGPTYAVAGCVPATGRCVRIVADW